MVVGILTVELSIEGAFCLKDKRSVLNRMRDKVRKKFNVAFAEVADNDIWNVGVVGIVTVSNDQKHVNSMLDKVVDFIETLPDCDVEDYSIEYA